MYKAAFRWMIRTSIARLDAGDRRLALLLFAGDATLAFPGDNSWARQHRPIQLGRDAFPTHRGRREIDAFLRRFVAEGVHMEVDDILVNGPPWNTRVAVRVHHWIPGDGNDGDDRYNNRAILFVNVKWGRIRAQEDYEDTQRVAAYDHVSTVDDQG